MEKHGQARQIRVIRVDSLFKNILVAAGGRAGPSVAEDLLQLLGDKGLGNGKMWRFVGNSVDSGVWLNYHAR
jgi:hypothetical protein